MTDRRPNSARRPGTPRCRSLPPCVGENPRVLILGSMPGGESLRQQQYYAFPRNAFWRIMGEICGFAPSRKAGAEGDPATVPYAERLRRLQERHIALWDVLAACHREGSLDTAIRDARPNDIPGILRRNPGITTVLCNGSAAGRFLKRFFPDIFARAAVLPSTSPAAAMYSYAEKLARWRAAIP